jgi:hypothetical protein
MTENYDYADACRRMNTLREFANEGDPVYITVVAIGDAMAKVYAEDNDFTRDDLAVIAKAVLQLSGMLGSLVRTEPEIDPLAIPAIVGILGAHLHVRELAL